MSVPKILEWFGRISTGLSYCNSTQCYNVLEKTVPLLVFE